MSSNSIIVDFPNAEEVDEQHRNKVVISILFKMKNQNDTLNNHQNHIELKRYPSDIISDERKSYLMKLIGKIDPFMLIEEYNENLTAYENINNFTLKYPNIYLDDYQQEEVVYIKYEIQKSVGCEHYIRGCQKQCNTCKKFYPCRLCHDANEDHTLPRYETQVIKCNYCQTEQEFGQQCTKCQKFFGKYTCQICKIICNMGADQKPNYHCSKCGICRVGLSTKNIHCDKCNQCYHQDKFHIHICTQLDEQCNICMASLINCNVDVMTFECKHSMHYHCYSQLLDQGILNCPTCKKSLLFQEQKDQFNNEMVDHRKNYLMDVRFYRQLVVVQCNDCGGILHQRYSAAAWCYRCGSYNCDAQFNFPKDNRPIIESYISLIESTYKFPQQKYKTIFDLNKVFKESFKLNLWQIQKQTGYNVFFNFYKYCNCMNQFPKTVKKLKGLLKDYQKNSNE